MTKRILFFIVGLAILIPLLLYLFSQIGVKSPKDFTQIKKTGELRVVTDYSSIGYYVSGDTIAGFNHDLLQLLQAKIPFKIEVFLEASLEKSIEGLKTGKYDLIARNIPITSELRNNVVFTEPVAQNRQVLIQRKKEFNEGKEPLRSHLDLAKKELYVPASSPAILRIRNLSHEIGDTIYIKEDPLYSVEQLAMMIAAGEIDYAVCDEKTALKIAPSLPEIDYSMLIGFTHIEAWIVSEQSPVLLDSLNMWIGQIKKTKEYSRLYRSYYK